MKKTILTALILMFVFLLSACAKNEDPTAPIADENGSVTVAENETEPVTEPMPTEEAASLLTGDGWTYDEQTATLTLTGYAQYDNNDYTYLDSWKELQLPLQYLVAADGVEYIGEDVFSGCADLQTVVLADSVTGLGDYAFSGCTALTKVEISESSSLYSIGGRYGGVFDGCAALTDISFPDSVRNIQGMELLESAFAQNPDNWKNGGLYCGNHLLAIDKDATIDHFVVADGTVSIARSAFIEAKMTTIELPSSLKSIAMRAFAFTQIREITIPDGIETIDQELFDNCAALETVVLPASVNYIGMNAFNGCTSLQEVYFGGTQQQWESIQLNPGNSILDDVTIHFEG